MKIDPYELKIQGYPYLSTKNSEEYYTIRVNVRFKYDWVLTLKDLTNKSLADGLRNLAAIIERAEELPNNVEALQE